MNGALSRLWGKLAAIAAVVALALAVSAGAADAQNTKADRKAKAKAKKIYKQASVAYDLGKFDEAIEKFQEAYEILPDPNFLFNIGQAYRQKRDCKNAIYFYKRFLSLAKDVKPAVEADVKGRIADLEENCRTADEIKERPPDVTIPPDKSPGDKEGEEVAEGGGPGDDEDPLGGDDPAIVAKPRPRGAVILASAVSGPAFLGIGELDINGAQLSVGVGAGYPMQLGRVGLSLGAMFTYTPVPWDNGNGMSGTSSLTGLLFNTGLRLPVLSKLSIRGELGLGALLLSGLGDGNVFVEAGNMASGALGMLSVRVSVGAEYALTPSFAIIADPVVYSYSPAKDGLREDIDAFTRFELMAGLSYRR